MSVSKKRLHACARLRRVPGGGPASGLYQDRRGSVVVIFALALILVLGLAGAVIDYGRALRARAALDNALDAAVIVAANRAQADDAANVASATILANAKAAATQFFESTANRPDGTTDTFEVTLQDRSVTVQGRYQSQIQTTLAKVLGYTTMPLAGTASATIGLSPMVDIYLLIDVSASMALGATAADIAKLNSGIGCAFACHDGVKVKNTPYDAFEWAQKNNVTLRINEINKGIVDFVSWLQNQASSTKRLRIAVYAFSTGLTQVVPLTTSLSAAATSLPQAPSASGDYDGATLFSSIMPSFASVVGTSGDGLTTPKKLVIIATDGVQDPTRTWSSTQPWLKPEVKPFAPSDCRRLATGVSVGVLYAPYLSMTWDWGFNATLGQQSLIGNGGTRFDDIVPQLTSCASASSLFVNAATTSSIAAAFQTIFQSFNQVRLSR